jgi:hypothetical protein
VGGKWQSLEEPGGEDAKAPWLAVGFGDSERSVNQERAQRMLWIDREFIAENA